MTVEHYVNGRQVLTLAEASDLLHIPAETLRQRIHRKQIEAPGWITPRLPVYYPEDLGLPVGSVRP